MFERILYPTDFSDVSKKAVDYIKQLKQAGSKEVIVLHVIDERLLEPKSLPDWRKEIMEGSAEGLTSIEEELKQSGLEVRTLIKVGVPLREILKIEEEDEHVSAIVLGSHGKTNLEEMFLGSVSEKVIRKCKKPVLVIKR